MASLRGAASEKLNWLERKAEGFTQCAAAEPLLDRISRIRKNENAADSQSTALSPLVVCRSSLYRHVAADKSWEAPPSLLRPPHQQPSPFCSSTFSCDSVPPKEPPLLRCKAPPPKCLSTLIKELDPINYPSAFLSWLGFATVVPTAGMVRSNITNLRFVG